VDPTRAVIGLSAGSAVAKFGTALRLDIGTGTDFSVPSFALGEGAVPCDDGSGMWDGLSCLTGIIAPASNQDDAWDVLPEVFAPGQPTSWLATGWRDIRRMQGVTGPYAYGTLESHSLTHRADPAYTYGALAAIAGTAWLGAADVCDEYSTACVPDAIGSRDWVAYETIGPSNLVVPTRVAELHGTTDTVYIVGPSDSGWLLSVDRGVHWIQGGLLFDSGTSPRTPAVPAAPYNSVETEDFGRYALASDGEYAALLFGSPFGDTAIARVHADSWDDWEPLPATDSTTGDLAGTITRGVFRYPGGAPGEFLVFTQNDGVDAGLWLLDTSGAVTLLFERTGATSQIWSIDVNPNYPDHALIAVYGGSVLDVDLTAGVTSTPATVGDIPDGYPDFAYDTTQVALLDDPAGGVLAIAGLPGAAPGGPVMNRCRMTAGTWCTAWDDRMTPVDPMFLPATVGTHDRRHIAPHYFSISDITQDPADPEHVIASVGSYGAIDPYGPTMLYELFDLDYDPAAYVGTSPWVARYERTNAVHALSWLEGDLYLSCSAGFQPED
jgi:hypothetical protein